MCLFRFDVDFTEIHSFMTRSEAILQSPEFSISRKEGSVADLYEKVLVRLDSTIQMPLNKFLTESFLINIFMCVHCNSSKTYKKKHFILSNVFFLF